MKPTALVTGSAGFIGHHFAEALERRGYLVSRCDPRHEDSRHAHDCRTWFRANPTPIDLCVHCAALVDGRETIDHKAAQLGAYNLQLDGAMFEWALKARPRRIVYFSSSAAYPVSLQNAPQNPVPLAESELTYEFGAPDATYGWVKLTGERLATEVCAAGVPVTVVRPFSGYGEDQDDCYPFPAMIARGTRRDHPFVVWGDGRQVRDFIHVDDVVAAVLELVDQEVDEPVNLGTGRGTSMDELARMIMSAAGYDAPIQHLLNKPQGVHHRVAGMTRLRKFYEPLITLEEGIQRALEHTHSLTTA